MFWKPSVASVTSLILRSSCALSKSGIDDQYEGQLCKAGPLTVLRERVRVTLLPGLVLGKAIIEEYAQECEQLVVFRRDDRVEAEEGVEVKK